MCLPHRQFGIREITNTPLPGIPRTIPTEGLELGQIQDAIRAFRNPTGEEGSGNPILPQGYREGLNELFLMFTDWEDYIGDDYYFGVMDEYELAGRWDDGIALIRCLGLLRNRVRVCLEFERQTLSSQGNLTDGSEIDDTQETN